jgi:hypothetical protein
LAIVVGSSVAVVMASVQLAGARDPPRPLRLAHPAACRFCGAASWWNGWRLVFVVVAGVVAGSSVERVARWLSRSKCSSCARSVTCYPAEHYPQRQYQLDVVAEVVAAAAIGRESAGKAAARATSSATSARRWTAWVAALAEPSALLSLAQRIEQETAVGVGASVVGAGAARVLGGLEALGAALLRRGVELVSRTGLGRVLEWQHRAHGDVVHLVSQPRRLSPAMAIGPPWGGL